MKRFRYDVQFVTPAGEVFDLTVCREFEASDNQLAIMLGKEVGFDPLDIELFTISKHKTRQSVERCAVVKKWYSKLPIGSVRVLEVES